MPVFLVPRRAQVPSPEGAKLVMRHLEWSQDHYKKVLGSRGTFEIAKQEPEVVRLQKTAAQYKAMGGGKSAEQIAAELLDHFEVSRFECPWVFCCILVNNENWPVGGGRPINGGYGRGGGIVLLTSYSFERHTSIQATMRHELGHAFGLPHVDVYGYDQKTTPSMMAYHEPFKTTSFRRAPRTPVFIAEDLRGLALNPRVFPDFKFDSARDLPKNYDLFWKVIPLGPMTIPGHPDYEPVLESPSEESASSISVVNAAERLPSEGPGLNYRKKHMWLSRKEPSGQVELTITFPGEITLDSMILHTEHSGRYNRAKAVQIIALTEDGAQTLADTSVDNAAMRTRFDPTASQKWLLRFTVERNKRLCLRGIEYFLGDTQLFPPQVDGDWREKLGIDRPVFAKQ